MNRFDYDRETYGLTAKNPMANMLSSLMSSEMILPLLMFALLNREGIFKSDTEDLYRKAEILRVAKPYFNGKPKEMLGKTENIMDILYSVNRFMNGDYKKESPYEKSYHNVKDKPIRIMEAVRPYLKGQSKESIEKVLTLNDRIRRLQAHATDKGRMIENFEYLTDILEILNIDRSTEMKSALHKVKTMMDILKK